MTINARLDKLGSSYWSRLLKRGRGIVPAEGWYEWTGEKGHKQPWHIHRKDHGPLYLLALANFGPFEENREEAGFVLVTAGADGGMLDMHDRRPIVARRRPRPPCGWIRTCRRQQALELARQAALPAEAFDWYKVGKAVNNASADGPHIAAPIELEDSEPQ